MTSNTPNFLLRALTYADAPNAARVIDDVDVRRFMTFFSSPHRPPLAEAQGWIANALTENSVRVRLTRAIATTTGDFIGAIGAKRYDDRGKYHRRWELGYFVASEHRGAGIGRAAVGTFIREFLASGLLLDGDLTAEPCASNTASVRLLEHLGFRQVEIRPSAWMKPQMDGAFFSDDLVTYLFPSAIRNESRTLDG